MVIGCVQRLFCGSLRGSGTGTLIGEADYRDGSGHPGGRTVMSRAIGLNRKPVRHLPGKMQIPGLPSERSSKSFCSLTAAARNERSAVERKIQVTFPAGFCPRQNARPFSSE